MFCGHLRIKPRKCPQNTSEPLFGSVPAMVVIIWTLPNLCLEVSKPYSKWLGHFRTFIRKCPTCTLFNLRPKLPSRCVVLGSWSIYFFGCCLVNYCGGLIRWILWLSGSPGKEHHVRLVQGLSNWQVWAASPLATFCCIWSSGCSFGSCIPVSSLQYQLIGKLPGGSYFPIGELSQNWSFSFFICWIK